MKTCNEILLFIGRKCRKRESVIAKRENIDLTVNINLVYIKYIFNNLFIDLLSIFLNYSFNIIYLITLLSIFPHTNIPPPKKKKKTLAFKDQNKRRNYMFRIKLFYDWEFPKASKRKSFENKINRHQKTKRFAIAFHSKNLL